MVRLTEEVFAYFFILEGDYPLTSGPSFTEILSFTLGGAEVLSMAPMVQILLRRTQ
jgi:hypothetical protein